MAEETGTTETADTSGPNESQRNVLKTLIREAVGEEIKAQIAAAKPKQRTTGESVDTVKKSVFENLFGF